MPVSDGDKAAVASACERAWCKALCRDWKRAMWSGNAVDGFGLFGVAGGVANLGISQLSIER